MIKGFFTALGLLLGLTNCALAINATQQAALQNQYPVTAVLDFTKNSMPSTVTYARTDTGVGGTSTDTLISDPLGTIPTSYATGAPTWSKYGGIDIYETRTQFFLNNYGASIATGANTVTFASAGTYFAWCSGGASTSILTAAGTATITSGTGTLTCGLGTYQTLVVTVAGTMTTTVTGTGTNPTGSAPASGAINLVQVEGPASSSAYGPTPLMKTAAATFNRGVPTMALNGAALSAVTGANSTLMVDYTVAINSSGRLLCGQAATGTFCLTESAGTIWDKSGTGTQSSILGASPPTYKRSCGELSQTQGNTVGEQGRAGSINATIPLQYTAGWIGSYGNGSGQLGGTIKAVGLYNQALPYPIFYEKCHYGAPF